MSPTGAAGSTTRTAPKTKRLGALLIGVALIATIAGCSNSITGVIGSTGTTATTANVVGIKLLAFTPDPLTVKAGTTVTFRNNEDITHTVTSGTFSGVDATTGLRADQHADGKFDFHLSGAGKTGTYTFATPGTYRYYCSIHKGMNATIKVTA